ncbi:hypothetical protein ACQ859_12955 [Roseateles chitinivorans]|uniref:hypothetical protein n=1 Tax=Roseateles chitinivorans TaxID=2917965 RepID=UPI003D672EC3
MHKSLNISELMMRGTFFDLYKSGAVTKAEYMGVQAHYRPHLQPREPAEPFRPRK